MQIAIDVDGRLGDAQNASVSVLDRGFLFGEGVYETLRTYNRRPFLLDRHLARLRASAERIALETPLDDTAFTERILGTMQAVDAPGERSIRLLLTRGAGELSYDLANCPAPTVVVIVRAHRETPPDVAERGIGIVQSSIMRNHPAALDPRIKSNNLLNNALAMQEALQAGASEALMCNYRGELAECAQSNVFLVRGGAALTPPVDAGILEGVTRNFVFEVGASAGIPVREETLRPADLDTADELFVTSTTREVLAVTRVDAQPVGGGRPGPVTRALAEEFQRLARRLCGSGE
jgi:branched-chain amino acid aminotransferase